MLYGASFLHESGFDVELVDAFLLNDEIECAGNRISIGCSTEILLEIINKTRSDFCIINFSNFQRAERLINDSISSLVAHIDKSRHKVIMLSDFYMSETMYFPYKPHFVLNELKEIDFILKGDFKKSWLRFLQHCSSNSGDYRETLRATDNLCFELIDIQKYIDFFVRAGKSGIIKEYTGKSSIFPLLTSKGCNYRCSFCSNEIKTSYCPFSVSDVEILIKELKENGVKKVFILDAIANHDRKRFIKILDLLFAYRLKAFFVNGLRIDHLDADTVERLTHCVDLLPVSIESGDQKFLDQHVRKKLDLKKAQSVFGLIHKYRIPTFSHYIIGFPYEKIHNINKTLDFAWNMYLKYDVIPRIQYYIPVNQNNSYDRQTFKNMLAFSQLQAVPKETVPHRLGPEKLVNLH